MGDIFSNIHRDHKRLWSDAHVVGTCDIGWGTMHGGVPLGRIGGGNGCDAQFVNVAIYGRNNA